MLPAIEWISGVAANLTAVVLGVIAIFLSIKKTSTYGDENI